MESVLYQYTILFKFWGAFVHKNKAVAQDPMQQPPTPLFSDRPIPGLPTGCISIDGKPAGRIGKNYHAALTQNLQQPSAGRLASKDIFHKVFLVQPAQNAQQNSCAKLPLQIPGGQAMLCTSSL